MSKNILVTLIACTLFSSAASAQTTEFVEGSVGTIRQDTTTNLVRFNLENAVVSTSGCANKDFAVVFLNDNANFKNIYAAALTARALNATVSVSYDPNVCAPATAGGAIFAIGTGLIVKENN